MSNENPPDETESTVQFKESCPPSAPRAKLTWPDMAKAAALSPDQLAQFSVDLLFQLWSRADDVQILCSIVENGHLAQVSVPHFLGWWKENVLKPRLAAAKSMVGDAMAAKEGKIVGVDGMPVA